MTLRLRYAGRIAAVNVAAAIFVALVFSGIDTDTPGHRVFEVFGVALLFSTIIGTTCAIAIPRAGPRLRRFPLLVSWLLLVALLFAVAMAGSVVAIGTLAAVGYIPARLIGAWLGDSLRIAVITTLTFGIAVSAYEAMRSRLEEATLALRTKERDEAEARRLAAEAQLASLESRVQPHFLFNTLNSIAALIPTDPDGAERMTGRLAALLRASLDGAPLVPVEQELATVREYLDLEQVRFGSRLRASFEVDAAAGAALVPRFALQTLVENAVKYAVAPRRDGGRIVVRARRDGGRVRLEVEDDGPGFDPATQPEHHGLEVLRRRLALALGGRGQLHLASVPGRTVVGLDVPC